MLPGTKPVLRLSLGFCKWYTEANQTPHFNLYISFATHILAYYVGLEGSKVKKWILGMKNYIQIKHEHEERVPPVGDIDGTCTSPVWVANRPPIPRKLPVKHKMDTSLLPPPPADEVIKRKRQ